MLTIKKRYFEVELIWEPDLVDLEAGRRDVTQLGKLVCDLANGISKSSYERVCFLHRKLDSV